MKQIVHQDGDRRTTLRVDETGSVVSAVTTTLLPPSVAGLRGLGLRAEGALR